jgi:hypothetical protein
MTTADKYTIGLDLMGEMETIDLRMLLLNDAGYTFDSTHENVADVVPATNEITGTGTEVSTAMLLFLHVTNDADSILIARYPIAHLSQSHAGYTRQTLASKTRTVDQGGSRIIYDCADPTFGGGRTVELALTTGLGYVD